MNTRKLALITGGTSGIGLGAARALLGEYDLALGFAANREKAQAAQAELQKLAPPAAQIRTFEAKITGVPDAEAFYGQVTDAFGRAPNVLVNSAGRIDDGLFLEVPMDRHASLIEEHLIAAMALCRRAAHDMYRAKWGRIVNLSSISAQYAKRGQSAYAAAKAGLEAFTRTLALEIAHRGVTVNAVAPGLIETPMTKDLLAKIGEDPRELRRRIPAGFAGTPEDVGALVAYLCSDGARYVTGQTITIDGGRSLGDPQS